MASKLIRVICATFLIAATPVAMSAQSAQPSVPLAPQSPAAVVVPDGTAVKLSLEHNLNSATSEVGETIYFRVVDEIRVGNVVAIPTGTTALGHIVTDEHKKTMGRGGKLEFAIDYVKPYDSQVKVRATAQRQGKDATGKVITFTVLISPLFLLMHGKEAVIPQGTMVTAYVDGKQEVPVSLAAASAGPIIVPTASLQTNGIAASSAEATSPPHNGAAEQASSITVTSDPPGADISVDGEFMGNAPSTLKVATGHRTIKATKSGYKDWERALTVNPGGEVKLNITLEKTAN